MATLRDGRETVQHSVRDGGQDAASPMHNLLLCLALSLSFTSTWLLNAAGYPAVDHLTAAVRYSSPLVGAVMAFAFALVSQRRPDLFCGRPMLAVTLALLVLSTAGFSAAAAWGSAPLAEVAASARWTACVLRDIVLGFALLGLAQRDCLMVLAGGYFLRYLWIFALRMAPEQVQLAAFFTCAPVGLLMLWPFARPHLAHVAGLDTPANLSVTNPMSFLPLTNRMFGAIVLFHIILGFSTTFGAVGSYAAAGEVSLLVFAAVFALVAARRVHAIDTLYAMSFLLALAGALLVPGLGGGSGLAAFWCNALCETGSSLFSLTVWYLGARLGARNIAGMLPILCMVRAARGFGIAIGGASGSGINQLATTAAGGDGLADILLALLILGFVAYNFLFARVFSFDTTAEGVAPLAELRPVEELRPELSPTGPTIDAACADLASMAFLTARELDVLHLLAKGRNAAFIQEELGLTRNTAKSYVADVYRKLGVHSHQELIDLVERGQRADA